MARYRRRFHIVVLCVLVAGCGGPQEKKSTGSNTSKLREVAAATLSAEADRDRQKLVKDDLNRLTEQTLVFSAQNLGPKDKQLLAVLHQAALVVDELNLLQTNPRMLAFRQEVQQHGSSDDQRLFHRNHGPWCLGTMDVRCCALRSMPSREVGLHAWPSKMTPKDYQKIESSPNAAALLSPYTLVRRKGTKFVAVAPAVDPLLGPHVKKLSALLRQAAGITDEPTLKAYLGSRAKALVSSAPFPFHDSDQLWVKLAGRWEVAVGLYGTARDPRRIKARYAMYVGLEDPTLTEILEQWRKDARALDGRLAGQIGRYYRRRKTLPDLTTRVVQVIRAAGNARAPEGAATSYRLPVPATATGGGKHLGKKVVMVNHLRSYASVLRTQARLLLGEQQGALVTEEAALQNALWREFAYHLGPQPEQEIKVKGQTTTVAATLGNLARTFEELKVSTVVLFRIHDSARQGKLDEQQQTGRFLTALVQLADQLQGELDHPRTQAAAILLGLLTEQRKGPAYDAATNRWSVPSIRWLRRGVKAITRRLGRLLMKGDRGEAEKLYAAYFSEKGGRLQLSEKMDQARMRTKETFLQAGIKKLALAYKVTDLPAAPAVAKTKPRKKKPKAKPAPKKTKPKKTALKKAEPKKAEPKKAEPKKAGPKKKAEPKKAEPKKAEPKKAEPKKAEPKKPKKAEPKKAEPKKAGLKKKAEPKKPKKAEPKEPKKAEPKKKSG
jgi:hypothetical protein